jgi:hypothetical protein
VSDRLDGARPIAGSAKHNRAQRTGAETAIRATAARLARARRISTRSGSGDGGSGGTRMPGMAATARDAITVLARLRRRHTVARRVRVS